MQLDFRILPVIFIFIFFLIYVLSYFSLITILIVICVNILILIIFGRSISERSATKLKSPANLEFSLSRKGNKKSLSPHSRSRSGYRQYSKNISTDENMHRNGFSNSSFNDKKFDRSFDKWRSPVNNSSGMRSPGIRVASPVAGIGLRTRTSSPLVSRRHSFSVKSLDTSHTTTNCDRNSRIPFLPTIKRALGLETIVSPRYTGKDDYSSYTSHPETASPGFVPAVRLSHHDRHPLSKVRSSVVRSPNTIKIAPPDPHKLGSPRMLEVRRKDPVTEDTRRTPDMQSVLTALKEKRRKRTAGPSEEDTYCPEVPIQKSKRRRQESQQSNASTSSLPPLPASLPDLSVSDYTIPRLETPSLKRAAAPEVSEWDGRGSNAKRLRQEGRFNSISSSLSSSRYLERHNRSYSPRPDWSQESTAELKRAIQREINKITQEMPSDLVTSLRLQCEGAQDHSGKENLDVPVSTSVQDPDSSLSSLQRADTVMLKPSLDTEDQSLEVSTSDASLLDQSQNKTINMRQKVTLNKSFSVRKRQMSLYTGLNKSFSKVPKSNVVACMEDYEADREAEQRRVEQMLEDIVSSEEVAKNNTKGSVPGVTVSTVSTAVITPTAGSSTSNTTPAKSSIGLPNLSVNPLFVSKSTTTSTATPATVKVSTTQGVGVVSTSTQNSTPAPTSASSSLASPLSLLESGTRTTMSGAPTMSLGIQIANTSVAASTPRTNLFAGLPSSTAASLPSTTVASVSSSKVSPPFTGGFSMGSVAAPVQTTINTQSDTNSTPLTKFGLQTAESGTVGAALASVVAAAYSSKAPDLLNFGAASPSKHTPALSNFGGYTNVADTTVQPSFGGASNTSTTAGLPSFGGASNTSTAGLPSFGGASNTSTTLGLPSFGGASNTSTTAGLPSFGGVNNVVTATVAPTANASGNTATSAFSAASTANTTGFPFGVAASNVNVPSGGAPTPQFGNTTQSIPAATFNSSTGTNPTFGANNFQNTTAATFGTGAPTSQPQFTPVFGTPNPTTQANAFGASTGNPPAFGSATPTFGTPQNKQAFGNPVPEVTKAATAGGFNFGGGATQTVQAPVFGGGATQTVQAPAFGGGATQTVQAPVFGGGATQSVQAPVFGGGATQTVQAPVFGGGATQTVKSPVFGSATIPAASTPGFNAASSTPAPSTFNFGAQTQTTTNTSTFNFGGNAPTQSTNSSSFNFGASNPTTTAAASTFNFGGTSNSKPQTTSAFGFGGAPNPKPQTTSTFNFGGASNPTTTASTFSFGATASTASGFNFGANATNTGAAAPAFGVAKPQVSATPVFGSSKGQSSGTFQSGMTKSGSAPAFSDTGPSFGSGPKPSNPFGTSSPAVFSGNVTPAAPQPGNGGSNAVFGFGATTQQPSSSTSGFNFSAAGAGGGANTFNFGGNTPSTGFGAGSPAPGFGQAPSTPGQGMFTVGASNLATKPRAMTKAKRRGARR